MALQIPKDGNKALLVHNSNNLRQLFIKLISYIAARLYFKIWGNDLSQVYIKSTLNLIRKIYVKSVEESNLSFNKHLKLIKPLYGLRDASSY